MSGIARIAWGPSHVIWLAPGQVYHQWQLECVDLRWDLTTLWLVFVIFFVQSPVPELLIRCHDRARVLS